MTQEKIPYPHPTYDNDLIAKEIINGTYIASVNMMIRNFKTSDERYVYTPDSPDLIEKMQHSEQIKEVGVEGIDSNIIAYNRDKSLEDAVLPIYRDLPQDKPIIISKAMCPQELIFETQTDDSYGRLVTRYDDGEKEFFVGAKESDEDIYSFYKHIGSDVIKLFEINTKENGTPRWIYNIAYRNFFYAGGYLYEYNENGYKKILETSITTPYNFMIKDKEDIYILSFHHVLKAQNITTSKVIELETKQSISSSSRYFLSAYKDNYFGGNSTYFYLKDGKLYDNLKPKEYHKATMKVRFDYHVTNFPMKYNLIKGFAGTPKSKRPSSDAELIGIKEGFISVSTDGYIYYTKNYKSYINTGIKAQRDCKIIITKGYIYFYRSGDLVVVSVPYWSYQVPDGRYTELFLTNKLNDKLHDGFYIGD